MNDTKMTTNTIFSMSACPLFKEFGFEDEKKPEFGVWWLSDK